MAAQLLPATTIVPAASPRPSHHDCRTSTLLQATSRRAALLAPALLQAPLPSYTSVARRPRSQQAAAAAAAMPARLIDAHVHVWASAEDARAGRYPYYVS
jgi:hypothetical protein